MSEFSFPFTGGAGGQDGPYPASFFAAILEGLFRQDETSRIDASVLYGSGNGTDAALDVQETGPASNSVEIKKGKALVNGYYYYNNADKSITVTANNDGSGYDRIDTLVLEIDYVTQLVVAKIITGTAAASPVAPTLTKSASIYQVPIANITAQNLFSTILDADIDNSVREQGIKWAAIQGGTGLEDLADGDVLYAGAINPDSLSVVNLLGAGHVAVGDGSDVVSVDKRLITLGYKENTLVNSEVYATGSWLTMTTNFEDDAASYVTLAANQFSFVAGDYLLESFQGTLHDATTPTGSFLRLRNITAASDIWYGNSSVGIGSSPVKFRPVPFTSNGTDVYELQIYEVRGGSLGWGRYTSFSGTAPSGSLDNIYWTAKFRRQH